MKKTICFLIVPRYFCSRMDNTNTTTTGAGNLSAVRSIENVPFEVFERIMTENRHVPVRCHQSGGESFFRVTRDQSGKVIDLQHFFEPIFC